jgi:hypothetical protein
VSYYDSFFREPNPGAPYRGEGFTYFAGGVRHTGVDDVTIRDTVDQFDYLTVVSTALITAALNVPKMRPGSVGNKDKAFIAGGGTAKVAVTSPGGSWWSGWVAATAWSPSADRLAYSTRVMALVPSAEMTYSADYVGGVSTGEKGYLAGGQLNTTTPITAAHYSQAIDVLDFSTEATSSLGATLSLRVSIGGSGHNSFDGWFFRYGSATAENAVGLVDKFSFSTETSAEAARIAGTKYTCLASRTHLYPAAVNHILKYDMATDTLVDPLPRSLCAQPFRRLVGLVRQTAGGNNKDLGIGVLFGFGIGQMCDFATDTIQIVRHADSTTYHNAIGASTNDF